MLELMTTLNLTYEACKQVRGLKCIELLPIIEVSRKDMDPQ